MYYIVPESLYYEFGFLFEVDDMLMDSVLIELIGVSK